ncbi:glucose-1-phosphate thymidylyltransferase RfbA [Streptomyces sp. AV19]|uniref:glucose-1-phosphate thymidylyltransferase RfbA n=1 Tax=Streptomyces sp. AV19 TaxID=2793068 RepID=UPI0018FE7B59|nr:glucose-1-phosphate thymidylyltransferase RfbA [Streptomyces sp. AV19]MBH1937766.1 glucose-1-phosphate thymidylyltransferase RfbA [Streptomyces sp. AV19]MDG4533654.1 glucose-1-phosphate thymidylyltransferase RfbA [Streptomyces sp. AV19]
MRGILLAGGSGTRLGPLTRGVSKHLLPVHDKPLVYYPLSVLMLAGIRDILLISTRAHLAGFLALLGDGGRLGLNLSYAVQRAPEGIAQALTIGADHIGDGPVALALGDNIFHGTGFPSLLRRHTSDVDGCVVFGYPVEDPERYGVGEVDAAGRLVSLVEKPAVPRSSLAITGLYLYGNDVVAIARGLRPSARGELEITDVNRVYVEQGRARFVPLGQDAAWFDTGTHDALSQAGRYVQAMERDRGVHIGCVEEIAFGLGYIDADALHALGSAYGGSAYGARLKKIAAGTEDREGSV